MLEAVTVVHEADRTDAEDLLVAHGYELCRLDGSQVRDKTSLLERMKSDLPMASGARCGNWDAAADALWGGLDKVETNRVAIVWTDVEVLLGAHIPTFLAAVNLLTDLVRQVSTTAHGFSHEMRLRIVLAGATSGFPELDRSSFDGE